MKNIPESNVANASEVDEVFSGRKKIDGPLFFDSKPYSPYKWPVFFFYFGVVVFGVWFLCRYFWIGNISPSRLRDWMVGISFAGVLVGLPVGIFYLLNLLFPPKLSIDKAGVTLWNYGKARSLIWADIKSITTKDMSSGKYSNPIFWTIIYGNSCTLKCPPYLGVDPKRLAKFLENQRSTKTYK